MSVEDVEKSEVIKEESVGDILQGRPCSERVSSAVIASPRIRTARTLFALTWFRKVWSVTGVTFSDACRQKGAGSRLRMAESRRKSRKTSTPVRRACTCFLRRRPKRESGERISAGRRREETFLSIVAPNPYAGDVRGKADSCICLPRQSKSPCRCPPS